MAGIIGGAQAPGESTLQYLLRSGVAPNDASASLVGGMTGNTSPSGAQQLANIKARRAAIDAKTPAKDWFGNEMNDPSKPYYSGPAPLAPSGASAGWIGQQWTDFGTGQPPVAGSPASPTAPASGGGATAGTAPGSTAPAGGAPTYTGAPAPTGTTNPYAGGTGTGAGTTVPGPGGQPVTIGNTPTSAPAPSNLNPPGTGMWSGNSVPAIGNPGEPGYRPGHPIAPNIVDTTNFANPNPTYNSQQNPLSPLSTPTNPATMPQIDPQTGQVVTTGERAGTVQGQLDNILKDGNPLLEAARTRAAQAANQRGLINSSMAAQAGEEAALSAALPIAQQDAQTMENRALVNQNITNQFLSMREGTRLDLTKAYEAFKQNNYGFDKNAELQKYLNDSGNSNQQKIAALQAAVSQANTATQVQGQLEQAGMSIAAQQWLQQNGFLNQNSTALLQLGATNLANYANGLATIMSSQMEPEAKATAISNWNAVWAGQNLGGLVINGVQALPPAGANPTGSPTTSVPGAGAGQDNGGG